jgi:hypothetical protein
MEELPTAIIYLNVTEDFDAVRFGSQTEAPQATAQVHGSPLHAAAL